MRLSPVSLVALLVWPLAAGAQEPAGDASLDLSFGTHFPLSVGVDAQVNTPKRIFLRAHLGGMPPGYIEVINATARALDLYSEASADLIAAAIEQTLITRISGGYRPFPRRGLELSLGYTLAMGGEGQISAETIAQASGRELDLRGESLTVSSSLHALGIDIGWRWRLPPRWVFRCSLGYVHTVASSTEIDFPRDSPALRQAESYVDQVLGSSTRSPEFSVSIALRL